MKVHLSKLVLDSTKFQFWTMIIATQCGSILVKRATTSKEQII